METCHYGVPLRDPAGEGEDGISVGGKHVPVVPADRARRTDGARRLALKDRQVTRDSPLGHLLVDDVGFWKAALGAGGGIVADLDAEGRPRRHPTPARAHAGQRAEVRRQVGMRSCRCAQGAAAAARGRRSRAAGVRLGVAGGSRKGQADHEGGHCEHPHAGGQALLGVEVAEPQGRASRPRSSAATLAVTRRPRCSVMGVAHHLKVADRYGHMGDTRQGERRECRGYGGGGVRRVPG